MSRYSLRIVVPLILASCGIGLSQSVGQPPGISFPQSDSCKAIDEPNSERRLTHSAVSSKTKPQFGFLKELPPLCTADLPGDARTLLTGFLVHSEEVRQKAHDHLAGERNILVRKLQKLQDEQTRAARLDEAVAIRDAIRSLLEIDVVAQPSPQNMSAYVQHVGESFIFRLTGRTNGSVYGTNFYTYDSDLATAAVHAGVLKGDETGLVEVTLIRANEPHVASQRHGVNSSQWGVYPASFSLKRWRPILPVD